MRKFGAPATCIHDYSHWSVLLRPVQITLGSLVLAAHDTATTSMTDGRDMARTSSMPAGSLYRLS